MPQKQAEMKRFVFIIFAILANSCFAQKYIRPVFDRTDDFLMHLDSVEVTTDSTFLYFTYDAEGGSWVCLSEKTYLQDKSSRKRYQAKSVVGIPFHPNKRHFSLDGNIRVKVSFASIGKNRQFDFIENEKDSTAFNVYGIDLSENYSATYSFDDERRFNNQADFYSKTNDSLAIKNRIDELEARRFLFGINSEATVNSIWKLINLFSRKQDYGQAIYWAQQLMTIEKNLYGHSSPTTLQCIAYYYGKIGDSANQENSLKEALTIISSYYKSQKVLYADCLAQLSRFYYYNESYHKALKIGKTALKIRKEEIGASHIDYWSSLSDLALIYKGIGDEEKALELSLSIIDNCNNEEIVNAELNNLACLYLSLGNLQKAKSSLLKSIAAIKKSTPSDHTLSVLSILYNNLANVYDKLNDNKHSALVWKDEIELIRQQIRLDYNNSISDHAMYYYWDNYFTLFHRIFPYSVYKSKETALYGDLYDNSAVFAKILSSASNKDIIQFIDEDSSSIWKDIRDELKEDEAAVEFINFVSNDTIQYYALVLKKEYQNPRMVYIASEKQIIECKLLNDYYEKIWRPVLDQLGMIKNLYFSPSGILSIMPIEYAMADYSLSSSNAIQLYRLTSTVNLLKRNINKEEMICEAVLFGGLEYETSDYDSIATGNRAGFGFLPNSMLEVNEIDSALKVNRYNTDIYSGFKGTERNFKELSGKHFSILHLATHGSYLLNSEYLLHKTDTIYSFAKGNLDNNNSPEELSLTRSFLVMSKGNALPYRMKTSPDEDGILTAKEIASLDLHNVDIVVLSACQTGLGDIVHEGIYGLQRGFKKAGVNTLLMSLHKIDDEATRILMVEFYKNLMSGKTKQESLRDAQKHLREVENGKYDDPKYWASFIMLDAIN